MYVRRAIIIAVKHRTSGVLIGIEASKRGRFPLFENLGYFSGGGVVLR